MDLSLPLTAPPSISAIIPSTSSTPAATPLLLRDVCRPDTQKLQCLALPSAASALAPAPQPPPSSGAAVVSFWCTLFGGYFWPFLQVIYATQQTSARVCNPAGYDGIAWPWDGDLIPDFPCTSKLAQLEHCLPRWLHFSFLTSWQVLLQGPRNPNWAVVILGLVLPVLDVSVAMVLTAHRHIWPNGRAGPLLCHLHIASSVLVFTFIFGLPMLINTMGSLAAGQGVSTLCLYFINRLHVLVLAPPSVFIIFKVGGMEEDLGCADVHVSYMYFTCPPVSYMPPCILHAPCISHAPLYLTCPLYLTAASTPLLPRLPSPPASRTPGDAQCSTPKLLTFSSAVCVAQQAPGCSTRAALSRSQMASRWRWWCYARGRLALSWSLLRHGWGCQSLPLLYVQAPQL
jgi:hypothetical protein